MPVTTSLRLIVTDARGREVAVLAQGVHAAGPYTRVWDGRAGGAEASSGVYLIRLAAPGTTLVEKAIRVR